MEPHDDALVARAREGDDEAFRALFERHHRAVYRFVQAMTGDHSRTEDIVQETFVAAHRGLGTLRGDAKLSTWLFAIARNLALKSFRRAAPGHETDSSTAALRVASGSTPEARLLEGELARAVSRALADLDADKRAVFTLKMIEGLSYEEIAAITGSAVAKLKSDVFRAKARLRELLADFREERR
jgi:RNA polymerase sigma-70 factor (ECF subfamily)